MFLESCHKHLPFEGQQKKHYILHLLLMLTVPYFMLNIKMNPLMYLKLYNGSLKMYHSTYYLSKSTLIPV